MERKPPASLSPPRANQESPRRLRSHPGAEKSWVPSQKKKKKKKNPPKPRLVPFEHEDPDPTTPRFSILFPAPSPRGPRAPGGPRVGTRWTRRPTFWNVRCQAGKGPTPPQQLSCNPSLLPVKRISPGAGPPPSPRFWNAAWGGGVEGGTGQG